jgi:hypothetical protein
MNRRKAIKLGMLGGGMLPVAALAQRPAPPADDDVFSGLEDEPAPRKRATTRAARERADDLDLAEDSPLDPSRVPAGVDLDVPPANFREEAGHSWRSFDIARYASQAYTPENPRPQNAIVEWIFRRTGSAIWHGEKIAVLSAGKAQLRAYHNPRVLEVVEDYVERFTKATAEILSVRVRFVATQDTRWRYAVHERLKRIATGPHGQQLYTISPDDASTIRTQMMLYQGFKLLADKTVRMYNGQTMTMETSDIVDYVGGTQSDGSASLGPQPRTDQLKEGVFLRFSPLIGYEGDSLDAAIELKATTVKRLIRTKILTRRDVGPVDMALDVPEVVETRLNRTIEDWDVGQTLVVSAGIAPGILQSKTGFMNLRVPGTVPTDTEMLAFIQVEPVREVARATRRTRADEDDFTADEPELRSRRQATRGSSRERTAGE